MFTTERRFEILYWSVVLFTLIGFILLQDSSDYSTLTKGDIVGETSYTFLGKEESVIPNSHDFVFRNVNGEVVRIYESALDSFSLGDYVLTRSAQGTDKYNILKIKQSGEPQTSTGDLIFISEDSLLTFGGYTKIGNDNSVVLNWNGEQFYFPIETTLGKSFVLKSKSYCYTFKLKSVSVPTNEVVVYFENKQVSK